MTIASPIRLDRLQTAMTEVLDDALGSSIQVGWAYGEALWNSNFPTAEAVNLTMVGGPSFHNTNGAHGELLIPPTLITTTVDTATVAVRYIVTVNEFDYFYDAIGGDSVDDIRDALVALIVADAESPYTGVATANPGEFTLTPDAIGSIWQMRVTSLMTAVVTLSSQAVVVTRGTRTFTVALGCFSKNRFPRAGAWDIAAKCQAALTSPEHIDIFARYDVGVWGKGVAVDLSDLAGGHWESRVSFDVTLAMQSVFTSTVEQIDQLNMSITFTEPAGLLTFTVDGS